MHKPLLIFLIAITSIYIFIACEDEEADDSPVNNAPVCIITNPADEAIFVQGDTIIITVEAADSDDDLAEVRVCINDEEIDAVKGLTNSFEWDTNGEEPGEYIIKAEAEDDMQEKSSDMITIILNEYGVTDIDGNTYNTVIIGDQEWMAENLRTTQYNNGASIDLVTDNGTWQSMNTGAYCYHDNDNQYAETYGALYNWHAVNTGDLCPDGWHVPTDEEWKTLEKTLGMSEASANNYGYRGTNEGSKLAGNADLWTNGGLKYNSEFGASGVDLVPGGYRNTNGYFYLFGGYAIMWTATESSSTFATYRLLYYNYSSINRNNYYKKAGFSVRCVKDSRYGN